MIRLFIIASILPILFLEVKAWTMPLTTDSFFISISKSSFFLRKKYISRSKIDAVSDSDSDDSDLRTILEQIAQGKLTRQDWDFKNGEPVTIEPSFTERIQAIKMLQEGADDNDNKATIQFINNLVMPDGSVPKPNLDAPEAPPEGHYSLNMQDEGDE